MQAVTVIEKRVMYSANSKWIIQCSGEYQKEKCGRIVRLRCGLDPMLDDWDQWFMDFN